MDSQQLRTLSILSTKNFKFFNQAIPPSKQLNLLSVYWVMNARIPVIALRPNIKLLQKCCSFLRHLSFISSDDHLIFLLNSCGCVSETSQIHGLMVKTGHDLIPFPVSKLLASSITDVKYAASIFKHIPNPNLFMVTTMLRCYSISDYPAEALLLFNCMRALNISLDEFTFVSTLKSCARLLAFWTGCAVHSVGVRSGHVLFINVRNTLLHVYSVCGRIEDVHQLFEEFPHQRDLVSWNTLMGGYLHVSQPSVVLDLFRQLSLDGVKIGSTTMLCVLSAISDCGDALKGECLHGYCIKKKFSIESDVATALVAMYGKTGNVDSGRRVFDGVYVKDVVLWNCLMDMYAKNGLLEESLALLQLMELKSVKLNSSTLAGLLSACATSGALAIGQSIHDYVEQQQLVLDAVLGTALLDMYRKCGCLWKAIGVFEKMQSKDVKAWSAMILGYGMHGEAEDAITLFQRMADEGFRHNEVTFLAILSACSHGGLVSKGVSFFKMMVQEYGLIPKIEHYGCVIDLLGRAGLLDEAHNLIKSLPIEGDATAWRALLAACRVHGNVDLGKYVKKVLEESYGEHPADSIVLSSTCAIAGGMPGHETTRAIREGKLSKAKNSRYSGVKEAGCSTIELSDRLTAHAHL